jgi:glycogen debranching enzyme
MQPEPGVVAHPWGLDRWIVNARPQACRFGIERLAGEAELDAPWRETSCRRVVVWLRPNEGGVFEAAVDLFRSTWAPPKRRPLAACEAEAAADFAAFLGRAPRAPVRLRKARDLAAYVNWSAVVRPEGLLKRRAMLMSKRNMDNVWSWDHCFNAMALAAREPELAYEQFMVMADHQDAFGSYPDALNAALKHYNYSKPPVHGWALRYCMKKAPRFFAGRRLADLYGSIARWSEWWMKHRTLPGDRLPHYLHGNDSGWDNSTMFDSGAPLIAPDLGALLALQCEVLSDLASRLGRPREAGRWQRAAEGLRAALLERLWKGGRFIAIRAADGREVRCESLVPCMPLVLGKRLPADVRASLVRQVRAHLTPHGLATEPPWSPEYKSDGYWRGPIWAPSTLLVVDGLGAAGETRLARTVAARFCRLCAREGFAENFDALTGAGLRDRAYTWTSSVFLILASEYLGR